jgi:hypothetical protein
MTRKKYKPPKLSVYGTLSVLTASGSFGGMEGKGNGNAGKRL